MANRLLDSVSHYNLSFVTSKWTSYSGTLTVTAGIGVNGETALGIGQNVFLTKTFDNQATWTAGFNLYCSSVSFQTATILEWRDSTTVQTSLILLADGTLQITRGASTILGTTTFSLNTLTHHYVEFTVTINNNGSAEIRVDGNVKLTLSGVDTQSTANAYANEIRLRGGPQLYFYNIYINDGTGAVNNSYMADGPIRVVGRLPDAAGDSNQWLQPGGGSGATNYQEVDNNPPDVAHYVESSTPGDKDLYNMAPVALTGSVKAVQTAILARTTGAAISITPLIKPVTEFSGASTALASSYVYVMTNYDENPDTAAAWTVAEVDATQVGQEVS